MAPRKFILSHNRAPGDTLVMTALVRDIARAYPEIDVDVDTSAMDIWKNNPYLTPLRKQKKKKGITQLKLSYGKGIRDQNYQTVHFLQYFHNNFQQQTGLEIPVTHPTPDLHLSKKEQNESPIEGRYWVIISGGKSDFTTKVWHRDKFQELVNKLAHYGIRFVQVGSKDSGHWHPQLSGVLNLVGHTNLRDLFQLIYHSDGVVCGITMAMHAAAALDRPCVVLGGGREAWWWEAYVNESTGFGPEANGQVPVPHRYLHTIGLLDCCKHHGCWKNKVVSLNNDKSLCKRPIMHPGQPAPECLELITPEMATRAVLAYYYDGTLPPVPGSLLEQELSQVRTEATHGILHG